MLKDVPAVWFTTLPELPLPDVKVWLGNVTIIRVAAPATSVSAPQVPDESVRFASALVPDSVMLPLARGVPAVGRTWMLVQVSVLADELAVLIVAVMVEPLAATVALKVPFKAVPLMLFAAVPLPAVTRSDTVTLELKMNRLGAVRMIVPVPMSPELL